MILSMVPITELRGAIPIGIALSLNPLLVCIFSIMGSTLISIPLIITFRYTLKFMRKIKILNTTVYLIDKKIDSGLKKLKSISILGIIFFVGIPLPTTGAWTASVLASILKMRIRHAILGILIGNIIAGIIISTISISIF